MTEQEYSLTFCQWCNLKHNTRMTLNEYGSYLPGDSKYEKAKEQYHDLWIAERKEYCLREKNDKIFNALQTLKNENIDCVLCNYQNAHIKAKGKNGQILSYYATTETIAGYKDTMVSGLDEFIRLLK